MDGRILGVARCGEKAGEEDGKDEAGKGHGSASALRMWACFSGFVCGGRTLETSKASRRRLESDERLSMGASPAK
jgi:hypothetical protein